jgi:cleavage and polyadenylation specificity factor subunit 3
MSATITVLGGAEEIGANCCVIDLDGTSVMVDAGLHPKRRDEGAFPDMKALGDKQCDVLVVTHAHTDHMGGVPYVLRKMPWMRPIMTHATRDLSQITLHNTGKLLRKEHRDLLSGEVEEFYRNETIDHLRMAFEAIPYDDVRTMRGFNGGSDVMLSLHWAGHLLGSAGVRMECQGRSVMMTGDVHFSDQASLRGATLPRTHADVLVMECTNGLANNLNERDTEEKRLASFITHVSSAGGSVLIPVFALGKTQELLTVLYSLMRKGSIPHMPIYTAGMGVRVNKVYDHYCYSEPVRHPGFEISDIPQIRINPEELEREAFFSSPSLVVVSSGMLNQRTLSWRLAIMFARRPTFGIALVGYQDIDAPGYSLQHSTHGQKFAFGNKHVRRSCALESFRFTAHARPEELVAYVDDVQPKTLVLNHGTAEACDAIALTVLDRHPGMRVIVPRQGASYTLW